MKVEGHIFEHVCDIDPSRDANGAIQQVMPQDRYRNARALPLNRYGQGPFCKFKIPSRFRTSGVYIVTLGDEIQYVGECSNLAARFSAGYGNISPKNCFKGGQETNCRLNNLVYLAVAEGKRVSLWFLQTTDHKVIEAALRSTRKFAWNRV